MLHTLYPKQFTSTKSTYFRQLMTNALLDSAVGREWLWKLYHDQSPRKLFGWIWVRYHDPRIEDRLHICGAADCATGPARRICINVCICVCVLKCVCAERLWATDGLAEDGGIGGFKCVHVCACVIVCAWVRPCLRFCDPVCEDRCIDARSDG